MSIGNRIKFAIAFIACASRSRRDSPRPQFELSFYPLGLIAPALKPFAQSTVIEQEQPLTSPDRTMRIFLVVTNQTSISAFECST